MTTRSRWMTVAQVAAALGDSPKTINRRIQDGTIPADRIDGRKGMYLIDRDDVDKLVAERAAELRAEVERLEAVAS